MNRNIYIIVLISSIITSCYFRRVDHSYYTLGELTSMPTSYKKYLIEKGIFILQGSICKQDSVINREQYVVIFSNYGAQEKILYSNDTVNFFVNNTDSLQCIYNLQSIITRKRQIMFPFENYNLNFHSILRDINDDAQIDVQIARRFNGYLCDEYYFHNKKIKDSKDFRCYFLSYKGIPFKFRFGGYEYEVTYLKEE